MFYVLETETRLKNLAKNVYTVKQEKCESYHNSHFILMFTLVRNVQCLLLNVELIQ